MWVGQVVEEGEQGGGDPENVGKGDAVDAPGGSVDAHEAGDAAGKEKTGGIVDESFVIGVGFDGWRVLVEGYADGIIIHTIAVSSALHNDDDEGRRR